MRQQTLTFLASLLLLQSIPSLAGDVKNPPTVVQGQITQQLDALAASYYKATEPGATVAIVHDGKVILRQAYGLANISEKRSMLADDVLRLGSVTKQFTAVGIMLLAEEARVSLTDNLQQFFPDYPAIGKKITIEHLLTHTSGIPSYTGKPGFRGTIGEEISVSQMIDSFKSDSLEFEPGSAWSYSNSGYFLLGAIIEKVTGLPYAKFTEERLFVPLGMKNTAFEGFERTTHPHAIGYTQTRDGYDPSEQASMSQPYAAGALVSNVDDLIVWDAAISKGYLLTTETWKRIFTPFLLNNGQGTNYGFGWFIGKLEGSPMLSHGGDITGFSSYVLRLPQEKVYVAILTNTDKGSFGPEMVASRLAAKLIGKPIPDFKPISLDAKALDQFAGAYRIDDRNRRIFVREGDRLIMSRTNGARTPLQAYSANGFFRDDTSLLHVEFLKNKNNEVTDVVVYQLGSSTMHPRINENLP
jgi:D-alanyl-D-alanine carboxypeptidase